MANHKRRETLKIIGAVSSTCAFPFAADELFAQHEHGSGAPAALPVKPQFFTEAEMAVVARIADLIIPDTDTPGAVRAGVPAYIDYVVSRNAEAQNLCRQGLQWLTAECTKKHGKGFRDLDEAAQLAILEPLCERADQANQWVRTEHPRPRKSKTLPVEIAFFRTVKSLTADGYYTSQQGLLRELHYQGNAVLGEFPTCVHEH
ncbi:MAG: gluconate 2-dehydrogenase subunit 3 family protein [Bryobacterales bacterium]|nr:gluconate 2-dehydrogenase subunit 3 family protein [Bryobacterales bacterium]